jgi:uncharacterized membrane protein YkgB
VFVDTSHLLRVLEIKLGVGALAGMVKNYASALEGILSCRPTMYHV